MIHKKQIPTYSDFNESLQHLHLQSYITEKQKLFHIFKWHYTTPSQPIIYPLSRQEYYDITFFVKANFTHHINAVKYSLKNNSLHLLTPGQAEYFETETAARQSGYAFYFQPAFLFANISQQQLLKDLPFLQPGNQNVFNFDKKESQLLQSLFDTMIKEKDNANDNFAVLKHYLLIFLYKLKQISNKNHSNKITSKKVFGNVAITFQQLVSKHYLSITNIEQYAAMLFVTAKHLSEIVKKETGKLPKQIIHETILIEAKLLLQNTNMSIAEIASHLNFHDPSHFSNFFKAQTNVTPIAFRKEK